MNLMWRWRSHQSPTLTICCRLYGMDSQSHNDSARIQEYRGVTVDWVTNFEICSQLAIDIIFWLDSNWNLLSVFNKMN